VGIWPASRADAVPQTANNAAKADSFTAAPI
jgi:hypothetical protein